MFKISFFLFSIQQGPSPALIIVSNFVSFYFYLFYLFTESALIFPLSKYFGWKKNILSEIFLSKQICKFYKSAERHILYY